MNKMNKMNKLNKQEMQDLMDVLMVQSESYNTSDMEIYIESKLAEMGVNYINDDGNIYATKGLSDDYPTMVCHTDTVHNIIKASDYIILKGDDVLMGYNKARKSPSGIGGDDKVGIFMCLQMIKKHSVCKVAFFKDEEVGCYGSYDANIDFFKDARFVLECDRKGNSDFVNTIYGTSLQSKRFKKDVSTIIKHYGYTPTDGMLTDVYALKQIGLNVSCANMSCGYYNPHSATEVVIPSDVANCLRMCEQIFDEMVDVYTHIQEKSSKKYDGYSWERKNNYTTTLRKGYKRDDYWGDAPKKTDDDAYAMGDWKMCSACNNWADDVAYNEDLGEKLCSSCDKYYTADLL